LARQRRSYPQVPSQLVHPIHLQSDQGHGPRCLEAPPDPVPGRRPGPGGPRSTGRRRRRCWPAGPPCRTLDRPSRADCCRLTARGGRFASGRRPRGPLTWVELRGFEPLTPCMPLTSRPLAPQHASTRCLVSVLPSTQFAMKRRGAGCGDVRLGCWQIAGTCGHRRLSVIAGRPRDGHVHLRCSAVRRQLRVERRASGAVYRERASSSGGTWSHWTLVELQVQQAVPRP
jgi:hypothetical protein